MKIKENFRYKVLSGGEFQPFYGIRKLSNNSHLRILLSNGNVIKCSQTHKFICESGNVVISENLEIGQKLKSVNSTNVVVSDIQTIDEKIDLYDLVDVFGGNIFDVDGIVSHNCSFISSGNSVVDAEILKWYEENQIKEPISKEYVDRGYWKWTQPNYSNNYIVSADCGRGDGEDYSAFHVIDIENLEQVAEYKGKIETEQFGNFLVQVATEWNDALLIIENANIGWAVIQQVINREYKNLFYMTEDLRYVDIDAPKSNKLNAQEKKRIAGFTTSVKTRPLIISKLELCFREKSVTINSLRTISELYTFIWHNGKPQAANGYNDDLTMSLAIGLWVYDTALMLRNQNIELQKMSLGKMGKIKLGNEAVYLPSRRGSYNNQDPYKMKMRNGMTEDLRWLIK